VQIQYKRGKGRANPILTEATFGCVLQSARNEKMRIKSNINLGSLLGSDMVGALPQQDVVSLMVFKTSVHF